MSIDTSIANRIATITINDPDRLNALDGEHLEGMLTAVHSVATDTGVRAIIITGAGEKAFVAGAHIKQMASMSGTDAMRFGRLGQEVASAIERSPQPVIAAVNGYALGGGCELALACDIRICSKNAVFGQPETGLGIPPGWGGTQRLPRVVGKGIASELIYTGRRISATEAFRIGLVNAVHEPGTLMEHARALAGEIAANSPMAVRLSKRLIARSADSHPSAGLAEEVHAFAEVFGSADQQEGMRAFIEKRKPVFENEPQLRLEGRA